MNKIITWIVVNAINIGVALWFVSSLFDLSGILFTVKHTDTETKVSIEKPITTPSTPRTEEGPKPSW